MSCETIRMRGSRPSVGAPPPAPRIRVLVADGHSLIRAALRALLEREPEIVVVAEASDRDEAVALALQTRPDVVVMDLGLPGDGLETLHRILEDSGDHDARVLILATLQHHGYILDALRCGASGFIVKDSDSAELVRAVRVVAKGEALLSPSVTRRLLAELAAQPRPGRTLPEELDELTPREREVMSLVAAGLTNAEIADTLVVSPATAKTHVSRAMFKLRVRDRAQLVALAYRTGLVVAGPQASVLQPIAA